MDDVYQITKEKVVFLYLETYKVQIVIQITKMTRHHWQNGKKYKLISKVNNDKMTSYIVEGLFIIGFYKMHCNSTDFVLTIYSQLAKYLIFHYWNYYREYILPTVRYLELKSSINLHVDVSLLSRTQAVALFTKHFIKKMHSVGD